MRKVKVLFLLFLLVLPCFVFAKSSVWVAEKDNNKIILAGSVHLIHPSQLPLPEEYFKAFAASEKIVFEIDLDEMNNIASITKMINTFKLKGITIDQVLKPEVWYKLKSVMDKNGVTTSLASFDAAFISFSLPMVIWQKEGYQNGIDQIFYEKAKQEGKIIVGLETFDEQLAALATLKKIDPNILIEELLEELNNPQLTLETLIAELYQGKQDALDEQMVLYKTEGMDVFYQSLLVKRNKAWISQINQLAKENTPTMVIVGAMHLSGSDSVLQLLKEQGYKIQYYE